MHGWVNMGLEAGLDVKLQAFKTYGIPSFYGDLPTGEHCKEWASSGYGCQADS
jgi:hypothetical protein